MNSTNFVNGSPSWVDLYSPDPAGAAEFYRNLFGWTFKSAGPKAAHGYGFLQLGGKTVAGLGELYEGDGQTAWTVYFHTSDADTAVECAEESGGTVRFEPYDVPGAGRASWLTDPTGAWFGVWEPGTAKGLERISETNTLSWAELGAADPKAALAFYNNLFGWRSQEDGAGAEVVSADDGSRQSEPFGIISPSEGIGQQPLWIPRFKVADVDATSDSAKTNSGVAILEPTDTPSARIAVLADPYGAVFVVERLTL
ncbi:VOC family protein [Streptomyces sp. NPDC005728]|uniref:VOC family protein n=1 Tax=Streptomyces sp. NPDC005728 TaxID=3157054 RepID=UPI0033EBC7F3